MPDDKHQTADSGEETSLQGELGRFLIEPPEYHTDRETLLRVLDALKRAA